jgi:hypothetical protein
LNLNGALYGDSDVKQSNWKYAILDSGTRMIYMAHPDYLNFVSNVTNSGKYSAKLDCDSKEYCYSKDISCRKLEGELKDLIIKLDNKSYTVPAYGYLVEDFNGAQCAIAVSYLGIL